MRRHFLFVLILVLTAVVRFGVLLHSQTHVHSDEAIIGLMGKHILEGRSHPFYMYGQDFNAGAAWESYLATIPFALFGVGVVPLKSGIVVLSLVSLVGLYALALRLYAPRAALLAALVFALCPSLLKWHFQVRGYSWYLLLIPLLTILFVSAESSPRKTRKAFLLGMMSGLALWCLELALTLVAALWILLALGRKLSGRAAAAGLTGFALGYAPVVVFNLTHQFNNWWFLYVDKIRGGGWTSLIHVSTVVQICLREMPKFFGPDTVLWYYPETPMSGLVLYVIALIALGAAIWPFLRSPSNIRNLLASGAGRGREGNDLLMVTLTAACLVPYLTAYTRVPGYFLAGCFFLSILTGRLLDRLLAASARFSRLAGVTVLAAVVLTGLGVIVEVAGRNQVETLALDEAGHYYLARFPGADIEAVERHLQQSRASSAWTTLSFVYPLLFETRESLAVSSSIFGWEHRVYPPGVPMREPNAYDRQVFIVDTVSPFRRLVEERFEKAGGPAPLITPFGTLTVIEEPLRSR